MQDQDVYVVGAGNSAGQAALHLARHARTVTLLVRRRSLAKSMSSYLIQAIESDAKHRRPVPHPSRGRRRRPAPRRAHLAVSAGDQETTQHVPATALFVMIGGEPHTHWLPSDIIRSSTATC